MKLQKIDSFLIKNADEQEEVEEMLCRMMVEQNCAFSFFENTNLQKLVRRAYPNVKVC